MHSLMSSQPPLDRGLTRASMTRPSFIEALATLQHIRQSVSGSAAAPAVRLPTSPPPMPLEQSSSLAACPVSGASRQPSPVAAGICPVSVSAAGGGRGGGGDAAAGGACLAVAMPLKLKLKINGAT